MPDRLNVRNFIHGGDYNPDQWTDHPEIIAKDFEMFKEAKINSVTVGIFAWDKLEPSEGTYDFYLFSTDAWHNSSNINYTNDADKWYGKIIINIGITKDECEFYLDIEKVADKLGCDASDFKQIDAQFGRLGQQWVTTAGASTGAWLGLCICVLITVGVLVYQKKKGSNQVTE